MTDRNLPISWRAIVRAVATAYGITFLSGLVLAFAGITPQTDHVVYPLLALLTSAVGVALALRVADTTRLSYLVAIGVGIWLLSSTSVLLGAQSFAGWVNSSVFIGITLILGRLLVGRSLDTRPASASTYSTFVQRATRTHRNAWQGTNPYRRYPIRSLLPHIIIISPTGALTPPHGRPSFADLKPHNVALAAHIEGVIT